MKVRIRVVMATILCCARATSQTGAVPTTALHLTVNYPSPSVVSAMFGALPRDVSLIEVTACNDTPATLLLSSGRVVQALRRSGIQALSRDAAISTMQHSESRTWRSILLRNSTHGLNIVNFLVISRALTLGPALSNALPAVQALLQAIVPEFAKDVPDHQYLNFDRGTLAERMQLSPLDCAAGLLFTRKTPTQSQAAEMVVDAPAVNITPVNITPITSGPAAALSGSK